MDDALMRFIKLATDRNLEKSIQNCIPIDLTLIYSLAGLIVTYIIIVVQMV